MPGLRSEEGEFNEVFAVRTRSGVGGVRKLRSRE